LPLVSVLALLSLLSFFHWLVIDMTKQRKLVDQAIDHLHAAHGSLSILQEHFHSVHLHTAISQLADVEADLIKFLDNHDLSESK
jgi:hypothetical protein